MVNFFDVNFWIGSSEYWLSSSLYDDKEKQKGISKIRKKLNNCDIGKVLVTNKLALNYDWDIGNKRLLDSKLSKIENIYYSFILNPDIYFTYEAEEYIEKAYKNKVRLFRFFPKKQLFYINDFYMEKICDALSVKKFPVMLDLKQFDITGAKYFDINAVENFLGKYQDIPVIMEASMKQCMFSRYFFPLLEKFENLYLEISGLLLYDQIELYVEKFGSERLVFGTNYPNLPMEINTNRIILADIGKEDKDNIAFNNLNNIIEGIEIG